MPLYTLLHRPINYVSGSFPETTSDLFFFFNVAVPGLGCSMQDLQFFSCDMWDLVPQPGNGTPAPCTRSSVLATGPPGKSQIQILYSDFLKYSLNPHTVYLSFSCEPVSIIMVINIISLLVAAKSFSPLQLNA